MPKGYGSGAYRYPHVVGMYEQDDGSLWTRTDPTSGARQGRMARELVLTSMYANGNYTYTVNYIFRMDGGIDVRIGATGTTLNRGVPNTTSDPEPTADAVSDSPPPARQRRSVLCTATASFADSFPVTLGWPGGS